MIDFSTLQGLTIPEGVVTQIADASGRVLWNSAPVTEICYFRPSADISLVQGFLPQVDGVDADVGGYSVISEEVCDEDATTLNFSTGNGTGTVSFALSGANPSKVPKSVVAKSCIVICIWHPIKAVNGYVEFELTFTTEDGYSESTVATHSGTTYGAHYANLPILSNHILAFAKQNGRLPRISVDVRLSNKLSEGVSSGVVCSKFSQVYLELTCTS